jgi:ComF family protein
LSQSSHPRHQFDATLVRVGFQRLIELIAPPLCAACGAGAGRTEPLCGPCRRELRWLPDVVAVAGLELWAPVAYEGPARGLVRSLKFRGATGAAAVMAAQIAATAPSGLLDRAAPEGHDGAAIDGYALVPVPLHPRRLRKRGFNQAELLAAAIARRTGDVLAPCLERVGPSATQVGRDRSERLAAPSGTVRVHAGAAAPAMAILVDDVVTTGGTLAACASALRDAGTRGVRAVAYARTPGR